MYRFFALAAFALLLAGCGGGSSGSNPPVQTNAPSSVITVNSASGAPLPGLVVTLSTGLNNSTPTGVISTQTTNASGQTTFSGLPSTGTLCVSTVRGAAPNVTFAGQCFFPFPSSYTLQF